MKKFFFAFIAAFLFVSANAIYAEDTVSIIVYNHSKHIIFYGSKFTFKNPVFPSGKRVMYVSERYLSEIIGWDDTNHYFVSCEITVDASNPPIPQVKDVLEPREGAYTCLLSKPTDSPYFEINVERR